jgi:hypothetical protein
MTAAVSLNTMRGRAQRMAGYAAGLSANAIPATTWDEWLNEELAALYDKLVMAKGVDYYAAQTAAANTVSGTALYALPATKYALLGVTLSDGSRVVDLPRYEQRDYARFATRSIQGGGSSIDEIYYREEPGFIRMAPTPRATWSYVIHHIPAFQLIPSVPGTGTFDGVNGWESWACYGAAITAMLTQREDPSALIMKRQELDARITKMADQVDCARPSKIQDVESRNADLFADWYG